MPFLQWLILWFKSKPLPPAKVQKWFWRITLWTTFIIGTGLAPGLFQMHASSVAMSILWLALAYPVSLVLVGTQAFLALAIFYGFRPAIRVVYGGVAGVSYKALLTVASFVRR